MAPMNFLNTPLDELRAIIAKGHPFPNLGILSHRRIRTHQMYQASTRLGLLLSIKPDILKI
jgi:hypothetical protein